MKSNTKRKKPAGESKDRPKLRVIDGALSIYRPGDRIYFDVEGVEMSGTVEDYKYDGADKCWRVYVDIIFCVPLHRIKRVRRAGKGGQR